MGALQAASARHLANLLTYVLSADEAELRAVMDVIEGRAPRPRKGGDGNGKAEATP